MGMRLTFPHRGRNNPDHSPQFSNPVPSLRKSIANYPLTALSILLNVPIGPRVLFEYVAMIVDIRTSGHFHCKVSTAPSCDQNGPSMLNTWPRICSLIYRIGNLFYDSQDSQTIL